MLRQMGVLKIFQIAQQGESYDLQVFFLVLIDALGVAEISCRRPCSDPGIFVFGALQASPEYGCQSESGACYRVLASSASGGCVDGLGGQSFCIRIFRGNGI